MHDLLIVVDMQQDFVAGALGTPEAEAIVPYVVERIKGHDGPILYSLDSHDEDYLTTQEGQHLPVAHCIKGSEGWALEPQVAEALEAKRAEGVEKATFGAKDLIPKIEALQAMQPLTSISLLGLCTDICVISNALLIKSFFPEIPLYVDAKGSAGVSPESHEQALAALAACQVHVLR